MQKKKLSMGGVWIFSGTAQSGVRVGVPSTMGSLRGTQYVRALNHMYKPTVPISRYAIFSFCKRSFIVMKPAIIIIIIIKLIKARLKKVIFPML